MAWKAPRSLVMRILTTSPTRNRHAMSVFSAPVRGSRRSHSTSTPLVAQFMTGLGFENTTGDPAITIALLDTGLDTTHPDLVNRVFRSAHSLKGLAGMFGLVGIGDLAHHMEDILDALRLGRMRFDSPAVSILDEAVAAEVPCVLWADTFDRRTDIGEIPLLFGANLVTGIGQSLATREDDIAGPDAQIVFAWTEPGKPVRHGEPLMFPEPVGSRWGTRRRMTNRRLDVAATVPDEWAGIIVRSTTDEATRTLGIADLATHLEAIALASGAVLAASGLISPGAHRPDETADQYLLSALRIGLDIASFTESS